MAGLQDKLDEIFCKPPHPDDLKEVAQHAAIYGWVGLKAYSINGQIHFEKSNTPDIVYIHTQKS